MNLRERIARFLVPEIYETLSVTNGLLHNTRDTLDKSHETIKILKDQTDDYTETISKLNKSLEICKKEDPIHPIEEYCKTNKIPQVSNKAYKNKRQFLDKEVSVFINQFITPETFEVLNYKKTIKRGRNINTDAKTIGDKVSIDIKWVSDTSMKGRNDYYLYPEEIIKNKEGDCEDHSFLVSSINPEIGIAYGFLGKVGHAFNVFINNNKLYILETTGNLGTVLEYKKDCGYTINYLITPKKTFVIDGSVEFGSIARGKKK